MQLLPKSVSFDINRKAQLIWNTEKDELSLLVWHFGVNDSLKEANERTYYMQGKLYFYSFLQQ